MRRRRLVRIIRDCMHGQSWRNPSPALRRELGARLHPELASVAAFHGGAAYVHETLHHLPQADPRTMRRLAAAHHLGVRDHLRALSDLRMLAPLFESARIPWLLVKGPVLAAVHERADLRAYGDLDVVVPPEQFPQALRLLEQAGASTEGVAWQTQIREERGEVVLVLPSGSVVDLHWHLLNEPVPRSIFSVPMEAVLARARNVTLDGLEVPTLEPVDALLHLCLHTALSGGHRLLWFKDLERWLVVHDLDWEAVRQRAQEWRASLVLAVVLAKTVALMDGAVPVEILRLRQASRGWTLLMRLGSLLSPTEPASGPSLERLMSRATSVDTRSSLGDLARRFGHGVHYRMTRHNRIADSSQQVDQSSLRDAYLEQVASRRL